MNDDMLFVKSGDGICKFFHKDYTGGDEAMYSHNPAYYACKVWDNLSDLADKLRMGDIIKTKGPFIGEGVQAVKEIISNVQDTGCLTEILCGAVLLTAGAAFLYKVMQ